MYCNICFHEVLGGWLAVGQNGRRAGRLDRASPSKMLVDQWSTLNELAR